MGFPEEIPEIRDRLDYSSLVHIDRYSKISDDQILSQYENKNRAGILRYRKDKKMADEIENFGIKNLAQIYTAIKYTESSHTLYSDTLKRVLEEKKFL